VTPRPATTCPDWVALAAARDAGDERGETGWRHALVHLDSCGGCRRRALAADPTLVFRSLPRVEVPPSEAAAMREAVASMRRAQRVAPEPTGGIGRVFGRVAASRTVAAALGRRARGLAAAGLLAAASGGLWVALPAADQAAPEAVPAASEAARSTAPPAGHVLPQHAAPSAAEPVFMDLSLPRSADVYRVGNGGLQVVMVVDERLDV
jgi:hypothetical protein